MAFLCLSLVGWSFAPAPTHAPSVLETLLDHVEMIAEHAHSHGFAEDLLWAMHGHGPDAADHDHSQAFLALDDGAPHAPVAPDTWLSTPRSGVTARIFRIERPPRV